MIFLKISSLFTQNITTVGLVKNLSHKMYTFLHKCVNVSTNLYDLVFLQRRLEKVAIDGNVECCAPRRDGVTLNFDLLTQKRNQVISVSRCTRDKSLAKIRQQILEISRKHKTTT